jgi:hypothetical protein
MHNLKIGSERNTTCLDAMLQDVRAVKETRQVNEDRVQNIRILFRIFGNIPQKQEEVRVT